MLYNYVSVTTSRVDILRFALNSYLKFVPILNTFTMTLYENIFDYWMRLTNFQVFNQNKLVVSI